MFRIFTVASMAALAGASFSLREAQTALWLSAAAYCDRDTYMTRTFTGPTTGFVVTKVIYDALSDTNGFIGYLPSDSTIYVSFRGSQTLRNWITNLDFEKTAYTTFPECACEVHEGFYEAEQAVIAGIVSEVKKLKKQYPSYKVKNTGHSLGGALAQLTSMDLYKEGIYNTVYDFGQPRTGDEDFAEFATSLAAYVPTYRIVHDQDIVPHLPATQGMDFFHMCTEHFEMEDGSVRECTLSCEDPTCMMQYDIKETNVDDHLVYLGMEVTCEAVSA